MTDPITVTVNPAPVIEVTVDPPPVIEVTVAAGAPVPGPAGPAGASGGSFTVTAGTTLSGHRVVRAQADGTVVYATNTALADASVDVWMTTGAALAGAPVVVVALGPVVEPSWAWTAPGPVFLGTNGLLVQTAPTSAGGAVFLRQVGSAETATSMFFNPRTPIALSS